MPSNNVFQYSKIRTRKRSAKKSIKTGKKNGIQLFLESGIHCAWIRNPVPGIRNPQHGIQNPRLPWIPLHGASVSFILIVYTRISAAISKQPCDAYLNTDFIFLLAGKHGEGRSAGWENSHLTCWEWGTDKFFPATQKSAWKCLKSI